MYTVSLIVQNGDGVVVHNKQLKSSWSDELEEDLLKFHDLKFSDAVADVLTESIHESITSDFIKELLSDK